jgi:hypothetical protein
MQARLCSDRGAITIHVAIALIAMLAFSAMVIDQGVMYTSRRQAQTAADAGALAGALRLMNDASATTLAEREAKHFASRNSVWGEATADADIIVPPLPFACPDGILSCVRVDVFRGLPDRDGGAHGNTIPTYMMGIVGLGTQGVRATATAQIAAGNALSCIKPWIVADKWIDTSGTGSNTSGWDQSDTYEVGVDQYATPGFSAVTDVGLQLMLKGDGHDYSAGWDLEIDLNGGNGGNVYRDEISGCPDWVPDIGLYDPSLPCNSRTDTNYEKGCINVKTGVKQGPTDQGVTNLIGLDSSASWDTTNNRVVGGCTTAGTCRQVNPIGINLSPRVVPMALFDPQAYVSGGYTGNNGMAHVVNLLGFFIEGMCSDVYPNQATRPAWCGTPSEANKIVTGRLMPYPGQAKSGSGSAGPATFVKVVRLIR